MTIQGFPAGSAVKNLPANAGDASSIPDPGRSHMPWEPVHHNFWAWAPAPRIHSDWSLREELLRPN